jgi:hypothetical protein
MTTIAEELHRLADNGEVEALAAFRAENPAAHVRAQAEQGNVTALAVLRTAQLELPEQFTP